MKKVSLHSTITTTTLSLLILVILFLLFDNYVNKVATETMDNWKRAEEISIIEGNLLSAVTKNQKILLSSDFLKGVLLVDFSNPFQMEQIAFGDIIDTKKINIDSINGTQILRVGLFKRYVVSKIPNQPSMVIAFSIWSKGYENIFFIACALFLSIYGFYFITINKVKKEELELRIKKTQEYATKAARVAHDIRSPLMLLSSVLDDADGLSNQNKRLLSSISKQLQDITKDIIKNRSDAVTKPAIPEVVSEEKNNGTSTADDVKYLILEKQKVLTNGINLKSNITNANKRINISSSELRRTLSNLIDNSVEAIIESGAIQVMTEIEENKYIIKIIDNGKGIPSSILSAVGERGFSFGKKNGSGIGVYYAKKAITDAKGTFYIDSEENKGTTITIKLPFQGSNIFDIKIKERSDLLILDDDPEIHNYWKHYLKNNQLDQKIYVHHFLDPHALLKFGTCTENSFLLSDYDLRSSIDGLDAIRMGKYEERSILITGLAHSPYVQKKARKIPIIDKDDIQSISITTI